MSVSEVKKNNYGKNLKIGFIADGVKNFSKSDIFHDSSFALMLAAQELRAKVFLAESNNLKIINNKVFAKFDEILVKQEENNHLTVKDSNEYSLDSMDILFARKDPPINENYLSYILMLSLLSSSEQSKPLIINNPFGILKANEKLYALNFPSLIPQTQVSSNRDEILDFLYEHKEIVIKPLFDKGGSGVFYLNNNMKNTSTIIEVTTQDQSRQLIMQKYIPEVVNGDKRIIVLNGNPIGAVLRIPKPGELRANMNRGASVKHSELTNRDLEICETLKPFLQRDGLYFAGIDVIGNYLTEVNVTSPTGLQEIERLSNKPLAKEIISWAISRVSKTASVEV